MRDAARRARAKRERLERDDRAGDFDAPRTGGGAGGVVGRAEGAVPRSRRAAPTRRHAPRRAPRGGGARRWRQTRRIALAQQRAACGRTARMNASAPRQRQRRGKEREGSAAAARTPARKSRGGTSAAAEAEPVAVEGGDRPRGRESGSAAGAASGLPVAPSARHEPLHQARAELGGEPRRDDVRLPPRRLTAAAATASPHQPALPLALPSARRRRRPHRRRRRVAHGAPPRSRGGAGVVRRRRVRKGRRRAPAAVLRPRLELAARATARARVDHDEACPAYEGVPRAPPSLDMSPSRRARLVSQRATAVARGSAGTRATITGHVQASAQRARRGRGERAL